MQEVLLALVGHTGGLILETEDRFIVNPDAKFLTEPEKLILARTVQSGYYCKQLGEFSARVREKHFKSSLQAPSTSTPAKSSKFGRHEASAGAASEVSPPQKKCEVGCSHALYAATRKLEEILDQYSEKLVKLESELAEEPNLPLTHLEWRLGDDLLVLRVLHALVQRIDEQVLRGGPLLDFLWQAAASFSGNSNLHSNLWRMVSGAGQVLANQLVGWMIYGRLIDPQAEFFVGRVWDHQPHWEPGSALFGLPIDNFSKPLGAMEAQREWESNFCLMSEKVPQLIISLESAKKVLFVGKAVRVLLRSGKWLSKPDVHVGIDADLQGAPRDLTVASLVSEVALLHKSFDAKSPVHVLEHSVEAVRKHVASELRQLVVEESNLVRHLEALKGFYLLGYGDVFQTFLEAARELLSRRPPPDAEVIISHGPWSLAVSELEAALEGRSSTEVLKQRALSSRFEVRFVPQQLELQSFNDCARQVKLIGMVRLAGGAAELGLGGGDSRTVMSTTASATSSSSSMGSRQSAMLWLATRQRVARSFTHIFSFQLHAPALGAPTVAEYGCRFAWCCQHRWTPSELQRAKHLEGLVDEVGTQRGGFLSGLGTSGASGHRSSHQLGSPTRGMDRSAYVSTWTSIGECLAVEVTFCVIPSGTHSSSSGGVGSTGNSNSGFNPLGELKVAVYICHPGLGSLDSKSSSRLESLVHCLSTGTMTMPAPRGKVHTIRLEYTAGQRSLRIFLGMDSTEALCEAEVDLEQTIALHLGSAYLGLCLLPLDHEHRLVGETNPPDLKEAKYTSRDRPISVTSWSHELLEKSDYSLRRSGEDALGLETWFSCLELDYNVPWPLPLVLPQSALANYNRVFQLLLAFRHVHMELQALTLPRGDLLAWALRHEIAFFLSQILQYFQQDVVEVAHQKMLRIIQSSDSFDVVVCAHEEFMGTVMTHCFLRTPELHALLMSALRTAILFCRVAPTSTLAGSKAAASASKSTSATRSAHSNFCFSACKEIYGEQTGFAAMRPPLDRHGLV